MARKGKAFVINLDDKCGEGTHWTAARVVDGTLLYADPFGSLLGGFPPKELDGYTKRVVNRVAFQRPSTSLCGYYAICFVKAMNAMMHWPSQGEFEGALWSHLKS
jgi:hypothetical protein